eukprot:358594-Prymnesium_polylepis.1
MAVVATVSPLAAETRTSAKKAHTAPSRARHRSTLSADVSPWVFATARTICWHVKRPAASGEHQWSNQMAGSRSSDGERAGTETSRNKWALTYSRSPLGAKNSLLLM